MNVIVGGCEKAFSIVLSIVLVSHFHKVAIRVPAGGAAAPEMNQDAFLKG